MINDKIIYQYYFEINVTKLTHCAHDGKLFLSDFNA